MGERQVPATEPRSFVRVVAEMDRFAQARKELGKAEFAGRAVGWIGLDHDQRVHVPCGDVACKIGERGCRVGNESDRIAVPERCSGVAEALVDKWTQCLNGGRQMRADREQ